MVSFNRLSVQGIRFYGSWILNTSEPNKVPNQSVTFISAYCQQLEDMIAEKIDTFTSLRDKARNFRKCLNDEEAKSRQLMNRNY